jgi:hypothetical protein
VPADPTQLSQDKDFLAASPSDQIKYLSSQDADFAKASPADQVAYLSHLTGKQVTAPPTTPAAANYDQYLKSGKPTMVARPEPKNTLADVSRGAALGAAEGAGINLSTNPRDVIEGTFKNLGEGVKDLLAQVWEANAPTTTAGKMAETPAARAAALGMSPQVVRTGLDVIPAFIDQTATSLEQGGKDFYKAIQNKDWESAAQIAAKNATMIAMLKKAKEGAPAATATETAAKPTLLDKVQAFGRRATEATQGAKDAVTKAIDQQTKALAENRQARIDTIAKNRAVTGKALQDIDQQKIDLANQNQQIAAQNAAQADAVARRGQLAKEVDQESLGVGKDINDLENKIYKQANANFDNVRAKIGNVQAPPDALINTVKNVEKNILQDIPENVKEFRSILKLENTSDEMAGLRRDVMAGQGMQGMKYEDLSPDRKAVVDDIVDRLGVPVASSIPLTWDKLQSLKSRLDTRLRNGRGLNGDLKRSLFAVRDSVVDEMGNMAQQAGAGADWSQARDFYKQWREDFHEPTGPTGSGSPVAKAKDAVDPDKIRKPFANTQSAVGNRGISILNKYPQFGGDQVANRVNSVLSKEQEMNALPDTVKPTPLKPPIEAFPMPARTPLPAIPEKPTVDLDQVARQKIEQTAQRVGRLNVWDARIVASSVIAGVLAPFIGVKGGVELGASYVAMKEILARTLEKPKVVNWLARTPPAELDALNKLPGIDKVNVQHGLTEAAIELSKRRKFDLDPALKQFLGPANLARIAAVNSAVQTPKRRPGDQLKDLQAIENRTSNPAMPIGAPE